jgi:hypothetical protein
MPFQVHGADVAKLRSPKRECDRLTQQVRSSDDLSRRMTAADSRLRDKEDISQPESDEPAYDGT